MHTNLCIQRMALFSLWLYLNHPSVLAPLTQARWHISPLPPPGPCPPTWSSSAGPPARPRGTPAPGAPCWAWAWSERPACLTSSPHRPPRHCGLGTPRRPNSPGEINGSDMKNPPPKKVTGIALLLQNSHRDCDITHRSNWGKIFVYS